MTDLDVRVQRRLGNFGTPPDKECIRAILGVLTEDDAVSLAKWKANTES